MAAWNAAATIERALDSVLVERDVPLEVLVVDDASTDATADVVGRIAAADPRVHLIRSPANAGPGEARNRGLEVARGAWLSFLDADDRLLPGGVAALMRPTSDPMVLAVIGQRIWTDGERTWISRPYDTPDIREPGRKSIATHPRLVFYAGVSGKAFHRSITEGLRFDGRLLEDQPWAIRALLRAGDRIEVIGETVLEWSRPRDEERDGTVTSRSRSSAKAAAGAAVMAARNYTAVQAEADLRIADPDTRALVTSTYFGRLLRSDLGRPTTEAIEAVDPDLGRLLVAIGAFLDVVPPATLVASKRLMTRYLQPPIERWATLPAPARRGYWRMLRPVVRARPALAQRVHPHGRRGFRLACKALRVLPPALGPWVADGIWSAALLVRRMRSRRPRA